MTTGQDARPAHISANQARRGDAPAIGRRGLLGAGLALAALAAARPAQASAVAADWLDFRRRFMTAEGRVLDTANGNVSHSEGQGAALLFAVRFDDRASFDRSLAWTRATLRRTGDTLLAWRYRPGAAQVDTNNATDGDLMVAWALTEAAERWGDPEHRALATAMARDILRRLVLPQSDGTTLLLPGAEGFLKPDHVVVNPSYYLLPAFRALNRAQPSPHWAALEESGTALAEGARFGRWRLPADWVAMPRGTGRPNPAAGWAPRFSYDAVRVPLYLAWGGQGRSPALRAVLDFWADPAHAAPPAWADFRNDAVAPYPGCAGLRAVEQLSLAAMSGSGRPSFLPGVPDAPNYYAAFLVMLARLAWSDLGLTEGASCTATRTLQTPMPRRGTNPLLAMSRM